MVKIQTRIIRRKGGDKEYCYKQHEVLLPLGMNSKLMDFLDKQLDFTIKQSNDFDRKAAEGVCGR